MSPNPILKVLSTFRNHQVRALLIGGQATIVYGAAEFSRDSDFVILVTADNLRRLRGALTELHAENIYFPPLTAAHLRRGHACHFRCHAPDVRDLRVDLLARLRGCDPFAALWRRRTEVALPGSEPIPVIGIRDLVRSKKTQRDKDWLMVRRLVENDVRLHHDRPARGQARWWLLESRVAETLIELARSFPRHAARAARDRALLRSAIENDLESLAGALFEEERAEREADREYWKPLRAELERMRFGRPRSS